MGFSVLFCRGVADLGCSFAKIYAKFVKKLCFTRKFGYKRS